MRALERSHVLAVLVSLGLHVAVFALAIGLSDQLAYQSAEKAPSANQPIVMQVLPPPQDAAPARDAARSPTTQALPTKTRKTAPVADSPAKMSPATVPVSMPAPPAPSAEEWAFASRYTNKNSKGYRYSWGQQVRSMMGTAVEGPDQGFVRFRIEIAPDGTLTQLETLWATSAVAEQLARQAIKSMPVLPPTPTGKPLVFERTISFTPFAADDPPSYKDDCLPDPPSFRNPFVWDGNSPHVPAEQARVQKLDPQALEECLRQLPQDSIEAELSRDRRIMERWGSASPGR